MTFKEISPGVQERDFSMEVTLQLKPACGQTSWGGEGLMSPRMTRSEGRQCGTTWGKAL